jgi:ribosome-associated heat shock protein Hsp15
VNGKSAKPATQIRSGDTVTVRSRGTERVLEVATVVNKRVGAPLAAEYAIDRTPPPAERDEAVPAEPFARDRSAGRPTKKDRRRLDRLRRG